jgi:hypothetical protein
VSPPLPEDEDDEDDEDDEEDDEDGLPPSPELPSPSSGLEPQATRRARGSNHTSCFTARLLGDRGERGGAHAPRTEETDRPRTRSHEIEQARTDDHGAL